MLLLGRDTRGTVRVGETVRVGIRSILQARDGRVPFASHCFFDRFLWIGSIARLWSASDRTTSQTQDGYRVAFVGTGLLENFAGTCLPSPRVQLGLQARIRPGEWSAANQGRKISLAVRGLSFWLDLGCLPLP